MNLLVGEKYRRLNTRYVKSAWNVGKCQEFGVKWTGSITYKMCEFGQVAFWVLIVSFLKLEQHWLYSYIIFRIYWITK